MSIYIKETKFAASNLIKLIHDEEDQLIKLRSTLTKKEKHHRFLYDDFIRKDFDPDDHFNEHQMMYAFTKQAAYYESQIKPLTLEIDELKDSISAKQESIKSLSGALLQIAKQGISIVHGTLESCPNGRVIKNESIKNIIWQGRNQSIHYEERRFRPAVIQCFENIGITLNNENLAKEIIDLLNWRTYANYETDITSLLE
ncbi:hypothetical protein [Alkalihalophilus marmarensis]|uniref:hypothetical protein n=1 Tax=Alkalihalophilus marmarensis TaxID=521377 RepID=UPI002DBC484A|nr:hypothetical protein [Alkalihalophilus marmarensis]MEC2073404.1 hypothetical protein [Alkalihalophilus marmarensis]